MSDENIDYSEIPEFDEEFLRTVDMKVSPGKKIDSASFGCGCTGLDENAGQGIPEPD
ncbi:MAG: hypothetical protein ACRESZ_20575 [Methylococcales bacterium]